MLGGPKNCAFFSDVQSLSRFFTCIPKAVKGERQKMSMVHQCYSLNWREVDG